MSSSSSSSISAVDNGGATPLAEIHPDIIQSHILNRLDGPTLAAASCSSTALLSMCTGDHLWKDICNSTWPSTADRRISAAISTFPSGYRSFYSDAFPASRHSMGAHDARGSATSQLISAVDIYYDGAFLYSKVFTTAASSAWFLSTPFRLDLLDEKETVVLPPPPPEGSCGEGFSVAERLSVSWIVIDPDRRRAMNVASRAAVESGPHWLSDDILLRFASVAAEGGGGEMVWCSVAVTCGGKEGGRLRVKEVSMAVEDVEGKLLNGAESLRMLGAAMEGERRRSDEKMEREIYQSFVSMKGRCRERRLRRERRLDMVCAATGVSIFAAFLILLVFFIWR